MGQRGGVAALRQGLHLGVRGLGHGVQPCGAVRDPPAVPVADQIEPDLAQMRAEETGLHHRNAVDRAGIVGRGQGLVGVAGDDGIDRAACRQRQDGVFEIGRVLGCPDAGMAQRDHEVGAPVAQAGGLGSRTGNDRAGAHVPRQQPCIPFRDLRRRDAQNTDA